MGRTLSSADGNDTLALARCGSGSSSIDPSSFQISFRSVLGAGRRLSVLPVQRTAGSLLLTDRHSLC